MLKKIGTILDEELLKKTKNAALSQHTTLNHIFTQALLEYLSHIEHSKRKLSTVETSFGAMALPLRIVQRIEQEDIYETQ